VALSIYWKGFKADYPWYVNKEAPSDYASQLIDGYGAEGGAISFYKAYAERYNKPMLIAECAGSYHVGYSTSDTSLNAVLTPTQPGVGRTRTVISFFESFLNPEFLRTYPRIKLINLFEYMKREVDAGFAVVNRDFRATVDPQTLASFKGLIRVLDQQNMMVWAKKVNVSTTATGSRSNAAVTVGLKGVTVGMMMGVVVGVLLSVLAF
jgi:hypothetical protein